MEIRAALIAWLVAGLGFSLATAQDPPASSPSGDAQPPSRRTTANKESNAGKAGTPDARPNTDSAKPVSQRQKLARELHSGAMPTASTIEMIMEQAVKNISRRYNLNDAQQQKTREIMQREVNRFLKEHENEVWPVIRDLFASQMGARPPENLEDVKRIGKAARPLSSLAKDAIYRANEEWRFYLSPEQKSMHDYDLAEMDKTFSQIDQNFADWESGTPKDVGLFPAPPVADRSPPRPKQPSPGLPEPEVETFRPTIFETYVEQFIKDYELDQGQVTAARSILEEYKSKTNDFKNAKEEEFVKISMDQRAAVESGDREKIAATEAARKKLLEPVHELFAAMEVRLKALLTTAQIERFEEKEKAAKANRPTRPKPAEKTAVSPPPTAAPIETAPAPSALTPSNPPATTEAETKTIPPPATP